MSQSLSRALQILTLVSEGVSTLSELSERVGVHKTTVLRLLSTFEAEGFVTRDEHRRYRLGAAVFALSSRALEANDVIGTAAPHIRRLGSALGQTVHLAGYENGVVRYLDKVEPNRGLRMYSRIGVPAALHATAVAKVLLSELPVATQRGLLDAAPRERFTDRTVTDVDELLAGLAEVRERGWAIDHEEHESFMNCIGAPVRGPDGRIAAAISVSVPNVEHGVDDVLAMLPSLMETAEKTSADLGWTPRKEEE